MTEGAAKLLIGVRQAHGFDSAPVPEAALAEILEVARWTGSSGNRQPWSFLVLRDPATLARLAQVLPDAPFLASAPLALVVVMTGGQVALDAYEEGRVTERMLIAAAARGLDSAIGWILGEARDQVKALLGIPSDRLVRTIVGLGQARGGPARVRSRRPVAELVHGERW